MSLFVYPKHGMYQEMLLKGRKWDAKFIREQMAERAEKERAEKQATDVIMKFVGRSDSRASLHGKAQSNGGSASGSRPHSSLSIAGAMAVESVDGAAGGTVRRTHGSNYSQ
eukprot:TRINITY_DN39756_c0_g1_i1.p1 TRINITY_DN39756_c0_g1~~TRINITY_DN39756_c0_g1_i1.p1  ORF type:complete len:111 (+),score=19.30 TRINITY_DN39756_c0_g1_i1:62-394(+)